MNFNNNEVRKVMNHVSSRWLSLGKCLERYWTLWDSLMQWDSLESFFCLILIWIMTLVKTTGMEKPSREKRLVNEFK